MKRRWLSSCFLGGLAGLLFVLSACGGKQEEAAPPAAQEPAAQESAAQEPAAREPKAEKAERIQVRSADNTLAAVLRFDAKQPSVSLPTEGKRRLLRRRQTRDGYRWLERGKKEALALVRSTDNGFTVRTGADELLWRVRVSDEALLITDKTSGSFPFELRLSEGGNSRVTADGAALGEVFFKPRRQSVSVTNAAGELAWKIPRGAPPSAAFGCLLLPGDDGEVRYVLLMELLLRR